MRYCRYHRHGHWRSHPGLCVRDRRLQLCGSILLYGPGAVGLLNPSGPIDQSRRSGGFAGTGYANKRRIR